MIIGAQAQFVTSDVYECRALTIYNKDVYGFYNSTNDVQLDSINSDCAIYAYDKANRTIYLTTDNANCAVTIKDANLASRFFTRYLSNCPLANEELINLKTQELSEKFKFLNERRNQWMQDIKTNSLKNKVIEADKIKLQIANDIQQKNK